MLHLVFRTMKGPTFCLYEIGASLKGNRQNHTFTCPKLRMMKKEESTLSTNSGKQNAQGSQSQPHDLQGGNPSTAKNARYCFYRSKEGQFGEKKKKRTDQNVGGSCDGDNLRL